MLPIKNASATGETGGVSRTTKSKFIRRNSRNLLIASEASSADGFGELGQLLVDLARESNASDWEDDCRNVIVEAVRTALDTGDTALAERLVGGVEPRDPYAEHALVPANAALAEARGDLNGAVDAYANAADRWKRFGVVPEQAFALLGQGRCLLGLFRPTEAAPVLRHAREIFERLQAAPALAETDVLLASAA